MKLTKQLLDKTIASERDRFLWDESPKGFGVRIRPTGVKTFVFAYRPGGGRSARKLRYTIGRFGNLTVEEARKEAHKLAGRVASGSDPTADRAAERRAAEQKKNTVAVIADEFIERYAKPKIRSWPEYQRILSYYVKDTCRRVSTSGPE